MYVLLIRGSKEELFQKLKGKTLKKLADAGRLLSLEEISEESSEQGKGRGARGPLE